MPVLVAGGASLWEADVVQAWAHPLSPVALLKRCMDLTDLLATATTGVAAVAVIDENVFGLDGEAFRTLRSLNVGSVVVSAADPARWDALGADLVLAPHEVADGVVRVGADLEPTEHPAPSVIARPKGRLVAVWGPAGAPGRTSVAVSLASVLDHAVLVDLDPYGGVAGQALGVLDPVSGLLAASRLANTGRLDVQSMAETFLHLDDLRLLTGLPRADRWEEVRGLREILDRAVEAAPWVVADTGFSLESEVDALSGAPRRNDLTLEVLAAADEVVVIGQPDAVSLARLVRGLAQLADCFPEAVPQIVVNRMRRGVGWSEHEIRRAIDQVAPAGQVVFLPDDPAGADKAMLAGRPMAHAAGAAYRRALGGIAQALSRRYSPATV